MSRAQIEAEVGDIVAEELAKQNEALNHAERKQLVGDVLDELLGLGPLEPLLKDPTITDILVNGHDQVFVERYGVLEPTVARFKDEKHLLRIIQKIVSAVGRRIDESSPMVDARLADGSRVNAVVPPLALDGSLLSIRKFARVPISMDRLVEIGSIPLQVAEVLKAIVGVAAATCLISGGTGSGKTTLLNAMSAFIDGRERIVTIEDSAELQLQQEHVVRLETRPPNIEGRGEVAQRDLVKNALRMRPDRIIVGEVRAGEAFDMLQAMNTGHDGSMTTVHANTARDALVARRADDRHERDRHSGTVVACADRVRDPRRHPGGAARRRPPQARQRLRAHRHGGRGDHDAGDLPLPSDRRQRGRDHPGPVRSDRHPTALPRPGDGPRDHAFGRPVPARREVRSMNPIWIRTLVLVCIFGAVVLAAETLIGACASARSEGRAINLRLSLIGRGRTHGETMNILRRAASTVPQGLPPLLDRMARRFERMLMQAQLTIPTGRLMLFVFSRAVRDLLRLAAADVRLVGHRDQLRSDRHQRGLRGRCSARSFR